MKYKGYTIDIKKENDMYYWQVLDNGIVVTSTVRSFNIKLKGKHKIKRQAILKAKLFIGIFIELIPGLIEAQDKILELDVLKHKRTIPKAVYEEKLTQLIYKYPYINFSEYL